MNIDTRSLVEIPCREKAAFAVSIAKSVLPDLANYEEPYRLANEALKLIDIWLDGRQINADELQSYLLNTNDEGLYAHIDVNEPKETDAAINSISAAIAYCAWCIYKNESNEMPQDLEATDDGLLQWILDEAAKCENFDQRHVNKKLALLEF